MGENGGARNNGAGNRSACRRDTILQEREVKTEMASEMAVREWNEFPDLAAFEFDNKVREYRKYQDMEAMAKERKDELKVEIEAALLIVGQKRLRVGDLIATQCNGSTASKVDTKMLVSAGVDVDVIMA